MSSRPPSRTNFSSARFTTFRAFTLVELLTVMSIMAVLLAVTVPGVTSALKSTDLDNAARTTMNLLTTARTEAITRHQLTRLMIVTNWTDKANANYRSMSLWTLPPGDGATWQQFTAWENLPQSIFFDPNSVDYLPNADSKNSLFGPGSNAYTAIVSGKSVSMKYIEFSPSGAVRLPGATGPEVYLSLTPGYMAATPVRTSAHDGNGFPQNWAEITANIYTGRFRFTRP